MGFHHLLLLSNFLKILHWVKLIQITTNCNIQTFMRFLLTEIKKFCLLYKLYTSIKK